MDQLLINVWLICQPLGILVALPILGLTLLVSVIFSLAFAHHTFVQWWRSREFKWFTLIPVWYGLRAYLLFLDWVNPRCDELRQLCYEKLSRKGRNVFGHNEVENLENRHSVVRMSVGAIVFILIPLSLYGLAAHFGKKPIVGPEATGEGLLFAQIFLLVFWGTCFGLTKIAKDKRFMPANVGALFAALDTAEAAMGICWRFKEIRERLERTMIRRLDTYLKASEQSSALRVVYTTIANMTGNDIESGNYELPAPGFLDFEGSDYLKIHCTALAELEKMGALPPGSESRLAQNNFATI